MRVFSVRLVAAGVGQSFLTLPSIDSEEGRHAGGGGTCLRSLDLCNARSTIQRYCPTSTGGSTFRHLQGGRNEARRGPQHLLLLANNRARAHDTQPADSLARSKAVTSHHEECDQGARPS